MEVTTEYVEMRLQAWGRWARTASDGGLGYAGRTIEGRLRAEGGVLVRSGTGRHVEPVESGAEQMDRLVVRLGAVQPQWPEMLRKYYAADLTVEETARELGVSAPVVGQRWLPMARQRLAGILEGLHWASAA